MRKLYSTFSLLLIAATLMSAKAGNTSQAGINEREQQKTSGLPDRLITEQPAGKLIENMYRTAYGYNYFFGTATLSATDGKTSDVVMADDGSVYIKDPFSFLTTGTWLEGTKTTGDTIEIKLPQLIQQLTDDNGYVTKNYVFEMVPDASGFLVAADSLSQTVKLVWRNDSLIKTGSHFMAIANSNKEWQGFADRDLVMTVQKDKPEAPAEPQKAVVYDMTFLNEIGEETKQSVSVCTEGSDWYIGGLYNGVKNSWIHGTLDNGKITFGKKQFMTADKAARAQVYFFPAGVKQVWNEQTESYKDSIYFNDELSFNYDAASGSLSADGDILINLGNKQPSKLSLYTKPELTRHIEKVLVPANATIMSYQPAKSEDESGSLMFNTNPTSTDGETLNKDSLFYNIYFDAEKQTFYPDEYTSLKEATTDMPVNYSDYYDIIANGNFHILAVYAYGVDKVGVQMVYHSGGQETRSDIVYNGGETIPAGIKTERRQEIDRIIYTDPSGRKTVRPTKGLFIRTTIFKDGTIKSEKIVK